MIVPGMFVCSSFLQWWSCRTFPPPVMGARFTVFCACRPCGSAGWLALLLTKAGDIIQSFVSSALRHIFYMILSFVLYVLCPICYMMLSFVLYALRHICYMILSFVLYALRHISYMMLSFVIYIYMVYFIHSWYTVL